MRPSEPATPAAAKPRFSVDALTEAMSRGFARSAPRRGVLAWAGALLATAPAFPLLPVSRARGATVKPPSPFAATAQTRDENACDYWRYCAIDGNLCSTCGGGVHSCPPGTAPSPTSWIGTCFNPQDTKSYLIAYRDCCGQDACNSGNTCLNTDGDLPSYRPQANNDIIWCFGTTSAMYNCSTAVIVGTAE